MALGRFSIIGITVIYCWARAALADAPTIDLLAADPCNRLLAAPQELEGMIPEEHEGWVFIDEVQKVPALLDEVHRLIEGRGLRFALTGSSARRIRRSGGNLLAGRARTHTMLPLTARELGSDFDLGRWLRSGGLPESWTTKDPEDFLASYVNTYLQEEVQQEGITRNIPSFARFLRTASFGQASFLNISAVARECSVERKTVEQWFHALEDLLLAVRLPVFRRRAKRNMTAHSKFFLFDAGVYQTLRPRGPLDSDAAIDGAALETFVLNELRAGNAYRRWGYELATWRTASKKEVDFVLYGPRGLHAIEVMRTPVVRGSDLAGLTLFKADYPEAKCWLVYGGRKRELRAGVEVVPASGGLEDLLEAL